MKKTKVNQEYTYKDIEHELSLIQKNRLIRIRSMDGGFVGIFVSVEGEGENKTVFYKSYRKVLDKNDFNIKPNKVLLRRIKSLIIL